jgi:hypothetical protein
MFMVLFLAVPEWQEDYVFKGLLDVEERYSKWLCNCAPFSDVRRNGVY